MARNMSFALTTEQFKARTKSVTRRSGWLHAKAGDIVCGVLKSQGLKPGEKIERLGGILLTDVRREPLRRLTDDLDYGFAETTREGFPEGHPLHWPSEFVTFFCDSHKGCEPDSPVTRIEYGYLDEPCPYCADGARTGLPGNACENCMNTGLKYPAQSALYIQQGREP